MTDSRRSEIAERPVAMIRGRLPVWRLHDAPGPQYNPPEFTDPEPMTYLHGSYEEAREQALAWCDEHGYYLSSWSDGDDRRDPS